MWKKLKILVGEWGGVTIAAPSVAGLLIALRLTGLLQLMEWATLDQFFRLRPPEPTDSRIVIVEISESDIRKIGQWPIPDGTIAQLIEKLKQQQPRAIGLDNYRDLQVEPGHQRLVKVFETTPNLIGVKKVSGDGNGFAVNPPPTLSKLGQVGANDLVLDADGKVRRGLLFLEAKNGEVVASLGLTLALIYLKAEGIIPKNAAANPEYLQLGQAVFVRLRTNYGGYIRTYAQGYQILMNFRQPQGSFQTVSMTDVLENRVPPDLIRDRIVFIGTTAPSLQDFFRTPHDGGLIAAPTLTPGVEIHANLTSQILSAALEQRPMIQVWPEQLDWFWIFGWSVVGVALGWLGRYFPRKYAAYAPYWTVVSIIVALSSLVGGSYLAFLAGWWIPVIPACLSLVGSAVAIAGYVATIEHEERQTMMQLFERHVSSKIASSLWHDRHHLLDEGHLQAREMTATVLFTDVKGFSTIAEHMEPKELMVWLNEYMKAMAQVVLDHDGVVDKFIGDAVMAVFGVPIPTTAPEQIATDAQKAVRCALSMGVALKSLNQQWQAQGKPTVAMRVGIATGTVVAGSLGSDKRQSYTIIGDTVNVASRLESYNKLSDNSLCRILIGEGTYRYIQDKFSTKLIGSVLLKGRKQQVKVYQVLVES